MNSILNEISKKIDSDMLNFYLCDPQNQEKAYISKSENKASVVCVKNNDHKNVYFLPIDHNFDLKIEGKVCDCLLYSFSDSFFFFVELKTQNKNWINDACKQLENTIKYFRIFYSFELDLCRKKRAYACNGTHQRFHYGQKELMRHFRNKTGFHLIIGGEIIL